MKSILVSLFIFLITAHQSSGFLEGSSENGGNLITKMFDFFTEMARQAWDIFFGFFGGSSNSEKVAKRRPPKKHNTYGGRYIHPSNKKNRKTVDEDSDPTPLPKPEVKTTKSKPNPQTAGCFSEDGDWFEDCSKLVVASLPETTTRNPKVTDPPSKPKPVETEQKTVTPTTKKRIVTEMGYHDADGNWHLGVEPHDDHVTPIGVQNTTPKLIQDGKPPSTDPGQRPAKKKKIDYDADGNVIEIDDDDPKITVSPLENQGGAGITVAVRGTTLPPPALSAVTADGNSSHHGNKTGEEGGIHKGVTDHRVGPTSTLQKVDFGDPGVTKPPYKSEPVVDMPANRTT